MTRGPEHVFDPAVQLERTALAWERTAVALMVAGGLLLRFGEEVDAVWAEALGFLGVAVGALILLWSARRYESLHQAIGVRSGVTHPGMLRVVAFATVVLSAGAVVLVIFAG